MTDQPLVPGGRDRAEHQKEDNQSKPTAYSRPLEASWLQN